MRYFRDPLEDYRRPIRISFEEAPIPSTLRSACPRRRWRDAWLGLLLAVAFATGLATRLIQ